MFQPLGRYRCIRQGGRQEGTLNAEYRRYLLDAQELPNLVDDAIGSSLSTEQAGEALSRAAEFLAEAERLLTAEGRVPA